MAEGNNIQGLEELNNVLAGLMERAQHLKPALTEFAVYQVGSFQKNFEEGGRPAWTPSQRVVKHGGQTLIKSGRLQRSVTDPEVNDTGIVFGSNLPYARIMQFGGTIERKPQTLLFRRTASGANRFASRKYAMNRKAGSIGYARTGGFTITEIARPYIVFQPEDIAMAAQIIGSFLIAQPQ
jgi:phage gpG-like protein